MIDRKIVAQLAAEYLNDKPLFLVDVTVSGDNEIEVVIESDGDGVTLDDCVGLSRFIEGHLDREVEDFALTVGSAGLTSPFKVLGQYRKFEGREIEVTLLSGSRMKGILTAVRDDSMTFIHTVSETVEGQKKKVKKSVSEDFSYGEIKSARPVIRFNK